MTRDYGDFLRSLERGEQRAASKRGDNWVVHSEVKQTILDLFRNTITVDMQGGFRDKADLTVRTFNSDDRVRMVPGGTSVRAGTFIGKDVVIMPPSYINIGAYIDDFTMVDSHVLVGSCAQIGKGVHLSAAVQIGGVLEPVGHRPCIVEDGCFMGAGVILTEGVLVRRRAVIAPGVTLSAGIPIYDVLHETLSYGEIPENAVVVPGTRPLNKQGWGTLQGLQVGCAIIIKYRDEKTDAALVLEELLRSQ